jgi:hypothetical protein
MNIAQLHERIKNLSDNQLAQMSQGEDTAASLALMVLNERNDIREESQAQKPKPPTIAEQERAKSGIGMPPVDPRMIPQNILAGVGNPNMMPMPQSRDSGVSQLPAPVMMADGGLVKLADGGQVIPLQSGGYPFPTDQTVGDLLAIMAQRSGEYPFSTDQTLGSFLTPDMVSSPSGARAVGVDSLRRRADQGDIGLSSLTDAIKRQQDLARQRREDIGPYPFPTDETLGSFFTPDIVSSPSGVRAVEPGSLRERADQGRIGLGGIGTLKDALKRQKELMAQRSKEYPFPTDETVKSLLTPDIVTSPSDARAVKAGSLREKGDEGRLGLGALRNLLTIDRDRIKKDTDKRIDKEKDTGRIEVGPQRLPPFFGKLKEQFALNPKARAEFGDLLKDFDPRLQDERLAETRRKAEERKQDRDRLRREKALTKEKPLTVEEFREATLKPKDQDRIKAEEETRKAKAKDKPLPEVDKIPKGEANKIAKDTRNALVDGYKGDKKSKTRFNQFLIRLGLGTMVERNASNTLDAIARSASSAFEAYDKAKEKDRKALLEETKLDILREQNKNLHELKVETLAAKNRLSADTILEIKENITRFPEYKEEEKKIIEELRKGTFTIGGQSMKQLGIAPTFFRPTDVFSGPDSLDDFKRKDDILAELRRRVEARIISDAGLGRTSLPNTTATQTANPTKLEAAMKEKKRRESQKDNQ